MALWNGVVRYGGEWKGWACLAVGWTDVTLSIASASTTCRTFMVLVVVPVLVLCVGKEQGKLTMNVNQDITRGVGGRWMTYLFTNQDGLAGP